MNDLEKYLVERTREILRAHESFSPFPGSQREEWDAATYCGALASLAGTMADCLEARDE